MKKGGQCAALLMSGMFRVLRSSGVISPYRRLKKGIYMEEHGTKNNKLIFVLIDLTQQATISCNCPRYWTALMR